MNVLFLTTTYPTRDRPVDGIFVREHARAAAEVADVRVVHLQRARGAALPQLEEIEGENPPAWRLAYRSFGKPLSIAAFLGGPVLGGRRFAGAGWRPEVVHAHSFLSALPALAFGTPVAYSEHWSIFLADSPHELARPMRLAARIALRRADVVLSPSRALAQGLRTLAPGARVQVVPNVVEEAIFHPPARHYESDHVRLLTAGLLDTEQKRVDLVLDALARLSRSDVRLDVVGDGAQRPAYEQLAHRLGLDGVVSFHGLRSKPELADLLRCADLFVLGSEYENNPCVVLEALSCGVPVVAARGGGVPEVVEDDAGVLVEPGDAAALAAGIEAAVRRLDRFDRATLAERARKRYGRAAVAEKLGAVYDELVRAKT